MFSRTYKFDIIVFCLLVLLLSSFVYCLPVGYQRHYPVLSEEDDRYKVREVNYNEVLEFHQNGVTIEITSIHTYPRKGRFSGWFYLTCVNNSSDTVLIPYDSISLETDRGNVENIYFEKEVFWQISRVNFKKKPYWKISPFAKGERGVRFKIKAKEIDPFDKNDVITVKIQQIHKAVSNINMKFEGNFKVKKDYDSSF